MRISDWSSDVCSSDLLKIHATGIREVFIKTRFKQSAKVFKLPDEPVGLWRSISRDEDFEWFLVTYEGFKDCLFIGEVYEPTKEYRMIVVGDRPVTGAGRSEEHTYELQSLIRISEAVVCSHNN